MLKIPSKRSFYSSRITSLSSSIPSISSRTIPSRTISSSSSLSFSSSSSSSSSSSPMTNIRSNHLFNQENLFKFLSFNNFQGFLNFNSCKVQQFSHGQSNPTFMIINEEGKKYTIRKQPPGDLLPGAHAVDREYTVMTALKNTNVPIPNTRLFCNDKSIIGSPFFVYDYVEGQFFKDATLNAISSPETKSKMYFHLLDSLARIHAVNVDDVGLGSYGKKVDPSSDKRVATGYIARQIKTWSRNYKAAETEVIPDMEFLIAELPDLLPSQAEPHSCLVHGDYRMDNVLFKTNPTDGIAAILDWELSTLGDGLSDLAYLCLSYSLSPTNQFMKGLAGVDLSNTGIPTLEQAINIYIQQLTYHSNNSNIHSRLTIDECQKLMDYYIAFSLFRCTAILQGVYKRSILGNASAANASDGLKFAKESAHIGAQFLTKYKSNIARGPVVGSTFHKSHSSSSNITTITTPYPRLGPEPPALFTGSGLLSDRAKDTLSKVKEFVRNEVFPREKEIQDAGYEGNNRWQHHPALDELKAKAKAQGLWNLFLPKESDGGKYGAGFTNLEYALMAEVTGHTLIAPEVFNCSAPDTGNMEVLVRYGTPEQKEKWLTPLLNGDIRSCFAMTEPGVASSDATNMEATVRREGDELVLNGRKWWISGAGDPRCKIAIFMGRTYGDLSAVPPHKRHSMVLVPMDTPGVKIIRPMKVMGYDDAPHGHMEMLFQDVRVPLSNVLVGEGAGFEIAQGRLGPGRIHHCMRIIGAAERALELMCHRVTNRVAFGKYLAEQGTIQNDIALSRVEIDQARLLCLNAAYHMDVKGNKSAKDDIASIKIVAPRMAKNVIDRAIQSFGAMGLSQDTPLAHFWTWARILQLADGPDEVHLTALAKSEIKTQTPNFVSKRSKK